VRVVCRFFSGARRKQRWFEWCSPAHEAEKWANVRTEAPGKEQKHGHQGESNVGPVIIICASEFPLVRGRERGGAYTPVGFMETVVRKLLFHKVKATPPRSIW